MTLLAALQLAHSRNDLERLPVGPGLPTSSQLSPRRLIPPGAAWQLPPVSRERRRILTVSKVQTVAASVSADPGGAS
jgi:hypothetical protein